jgi:hypothetical protein
MPVLGSLRFEGGRGACSSIHMQIPTSHEVRSGAKLSTVKDRRVLLEYAKPVELVSIQPVQVFCVVGLKESNEGAVVECESIRPAHNASPLLTAARLTGIPCPILRSGIQFARDPRDMPLPCLGSRGSPRLWYGYAGEIELMERPRFYPIRAGLCLDKG